LPQKTSAGRRRQRQAPLTKERDELKQTSINASGDDGHAILSSGVSPDNDRLSVTMLRTPGEAERTPGHRRPEPGSRHQA